MGGKEFEAQKALDYLESRPALQRQLGTNYGTMKAMLESQADIQSKLKVAADLKMLKQSISDDEARFAASQFGRTIMKLSKAESVGKAYDYLLSSPENVREAVKLLPDASQRSALSYGLFDRLVEKATRPDGVFNSAAFGRLWATNREAVRAAMATPDTASLDLLGQTLNTISRGLAYSTRQSLGASERVAGGLRLWGLRESLHEVVTGMPGNELAIRPIHLAKVARDPRLTQMFSSAAITPKASKYGRYLVSTLGYALERSVEPPEEQSEVEK
jgi:hypothetical protein